MDLSIRDPLLYALRKVTCKLQLPSLHRTLSRTLDSDQLQLSPVEHAVFWLPYKTTDNIALEAGSPQANHGKSKSGLVSAFLTVLARGEWGRSSLGVPFTRAVIPRLLW